MKKKERKIGYIVEYRRNGKSDGTWDSFSNVKVRTQKSLAIGEFTRRCQFYFIPQKISKNRATYRWLKYRDLARCVPVSVEVSR